MKYSNPNSDTCNLKQLRQIKRREVCDRALQGDRRAINQVLRQVSAEVGLWHRERQVRYPGGESYARVATGMTN